MARFVVDGTDGLATAFADIATIPDDVKRNMLEQGGEKVRQAQKANAPRNTGELSDSIQLGNYKMTSDGGSVEIFFKGTHHTSKQGPQANAKLANVHEYGTKDGRIQATQFIRKANEESADAAVEAELKVYSDWLASHEL